MNIYQFNITPLSFHHIDQFIGLQTRVQNALSAEDECFIKPRTPEMLSEHLSAQMPIFGVWHGDQLVAAALVTFPDNECAKHMAGYPFNEAAQAKTNVSIVQNLYVDPDYRGHKLSSILLNTVGAFSQEKNRTQLMAKVAVKNVDSCKTFLCNAFQQCATGIDPTRGHDVVFYTAPVGVVQNKFLEKQKPQSVVAIVSCAGPSRHIP